MTQNQAVKGAHAKALDLFCGLGGWSDGLALEGFDVLGVEIEPKIAELYKHPVIVADVRTLDGENFKGFDLIVGSPPCRDFSEICRLGKVWWKRKPDPEGEGMSNVNALLNIVKNANPTFWLMENVRGIIPYMKIKPRCKPKIGKTMKRVFYGNFPPFLIPTTNKGNLMTTGSDPRGYFSGKKRVRTGPLGKWERARIPLPVSRALGKAVKEALK